jgi:hypothetical protein
MEKFKMVEVDLGDSKNPEAGIIPPPVGGGILCSGVGCGTLCFGSICF